ncbi:MAG: amidohydrolase family protein [Alphaproteobacteria bacterium]
MLNGDVFVFDNVVHMYDNSDDNLARSDNRRDRDLHLGLGAGLRPWGQDAARGVADPMKDFARRWTVEDLGRLVFAESCIDMAMAQAVPLYDVYKDGFAPVRAQHAFAQAFPERALFCGAVDPGYPDLQTALDEMTRQVQEMGAVSFKFYNGHIDGRTWRCDDRRVAYPLYERAQALGIDVLQFHKGLPITRSNLDALRPVDLQQAATDFPDLTFAIHHLAVPYFEETVFIAARFPNVVLVLSGVMNLPVISPWEFKTYIGRLLRDVGADRILWGSEAPLLGNPTPIVEWFWDMQIDEELQDRYGFPQITEADKRMILGKNQARLFNVDIDAKIASLGLAA